MRSTIGHHLYSCQHSFSNVFYFRIGVQTFKYILVFAYLKYLFTAENMFLNFTTVYIC